MNNLLAKQMSTLFNLAAGRESQREGEQTEVACEKCGEPTSRQLVGDEWYDYCKNCNWTTH